MYFKVSFGILNSFLQCVPSGLLRVVVMPKNMLVGCMSFFFISFVEETYCPSHGIREDFEFHIIDISYIQILWGTR
jgi:hypothetical protein